MVICRMKGLVLWNKAFEQEGFKKPGCMRQMPFWWANIHHRLRAVVLYGQRFTNVFSHLAGVTVLTKYMA